MDAVLKIGLGLANARTIVFGMPIASRFEPRGFNNFISLDTLDSDVCNRQSHNVVLHILQGIERHVASIARGFH